MRIPVNSEDDAFRLLCVSVAVLSTALAIGALTAPLYGVILLAGIVIGALAWELLSRDPNRPAPLREAASQAGRDVGDGRQRILVVANETVTGRELREAIVADASGEAEIRVVCPILPSRAHYIASDIDRELGEAHERLERTLAWASEHGLDVRGRVSEDTPVVAIADELRRFPADALIVSTHPRHRSKWLESGLVERLRTELDIPVRHVVVERAAMATSPPAATPPAGS